jgi:hypothetical protein
VLGLARDELLGPHAPGRLDALPGREAADPLRPLPLLQREVGSELPVRFCLHRSVLLVFHGACDTTVDMVRQTVTPRTPQKKRGPPATGKGTPITVRLQPPELALLDDWIAGQEIPPSRPEAIRYHFKRSLAAPGDTAAKPRRPAKPK